MSLKEKIISDFKEAFKNKDLIRKGVLSLVQSEIKNKEIELGKRDQGLSDDEVLAVINKAIKQRRDSAAQYEKGSRPELARQEQLEAEILQAYLPVQLSREEVEAQIRKVIDQIGAQEPKDLGKVMGVAMSGLRGRADGNEIKEIALKILESLGK